MYRKILRFSQFKKKKFNSIINSWEKIWKMTKLEMKILLIIMKKLWNLINFQFFWNFHLCNFYKFIKNSVKELSWHSVLNLCIKKYEKILWYLQKVFTEKIFWIFIKFRISSNSYEARYEVMNLNDFFTMFHKTFIM